MSQRFIFKFWLPLFASWLLMTMEGPIISATINRLPNEVVMLAAMGIVVSLSVTIESPIINLLATSTALSLDRPSYLLIRKFTIHWMILLTIITILIAFTPLFNLLVIDLMAVPEEIATWVKPGLRIMTFWSAAIAWRRFLQGILIRFNQTRKVAWGTLVRLVSSAGMVVLLANWSTWSGVIIGSTALMAGVIAEAVYATIASRPIIKKGVGEIEKREIHSPSLTYNELFWFHLPLATTSVLILLVQPLVTFSLARLPNPTLTLAAWPIVFQFMLVSRAAAFALPEVVIALSDGLNTFFPIRRFTLTLVVVNTLAIVLFVFTPLLDFYLYKVQDVTEVVGAFASDGLTMFVALPALAVLLSWIRGLLINNRTTSAVNIGMVINLAVTIFILFLAVQLKWQGINSAAIAITVATLAEFLYLWLRVRNTLDFEFSLFNIRKQPVSSY